MLTKREQFFYDNAGFSFGPNQTREEGHIESARELARAEEWAQSEGIRFIWEHDEIGYHSAQVDGEPFETCEGCSLVLDGDIKTSLWCILDATPVCKRLVEAELAQEVMP